MKKYKQLQKLIYDIEEAGCQLIAASKTRNVSEIEAAKKAGITHFGENYIQEAIDKYDAFSRCQLHLIGHLQTNKCKEAVKYFDFIHSIDSIKLLKKLEKECVKQGKGQLKVLIQVNQANEENKHGLAIKDIKETISVIHKECPHLTLLGFMAIPPKSEDASLYFKQLKELANTYNLKELSMGMSSDYSVAIKNGATYVRIGSAIFGAR